MLTASLPGYVSTFGATISSWVPINFDSVDIICRRAIVFRYSLLNRHTRSTITTTTNGAWCIASTEYSSFLDKRGVVHPIFGPIPRQEKQYDILFDTKKSAMEFYETWRSAVLHHDEFPEPAIEEDAVIYDISGI